MLIGVDHGNKQIKTVHCEPFVSGLKQSVTRPFGQNVLRYQNTYYTLSTERIPYRKDKTEDDRFFILTLFALAGEIEARGAYSSEVQRIQLAVIERLVSNWNTKVGTPIFKISAIICPFGENAFKLKENALLFRRMYVR